MSNPPRAPWAGTLHVAEEDGWRLLLDENGGVIFRTKSWSCADFATARLNATANAEAAPTATACSRCIDCEDSPHHWIEDPLPSSSATYWACKHCEARGIDCPTCDDDGDPIGCPLCGGDEVVEVVGRTIITSPREEFPGWIIGNAQETQWRRWGDAGPEWTLHRDQALRFARRADAEAFTGEDEDAWRIVRHPSGEPWYTLGFTGEATVTRVVQGDQALRAALRDAFYVGDLPAHLAAEEAARWADVQNPARWSGGVWQEQGEDYVATIARLPRPTGPVPARRGESDGASDRRQLLEEILVYVGHTGACARQEHRSLPCDCGADAAVTRVRSAFEAFAVGPAGGGLVDPSKAAIVPVHGQPIAWPFGADPVAPTGDRRADQVVEVVKGLLAHTSHRAACATRERACLGSVCDCGAAQWSDAAERLLREIAAQPAESWTAAQRAAGAEQETTRLAREVLAADAEVARLRGEVAALRRDVAEWLCESCRYVYPGPPQDGFAGVSCPRCNGTTAPRTTVERRELAAQLAEARSYLLADEERRKLTGDALHAEAELARVEVQLLSLAKRVRSLASDRAVFIADGLYVSKVWLLALAEELEESTPAAPAPDPSVTPFYLLERGQAVGHVPTIWWKGGDHQTDFYENDWTENAHEARHFPTREDANRAADRIFGRGWEGFASRDASLIVTEHLFTAALPAPAPAPATQGLCDFTQTERFANPSCRCLTYEGNLGPCRTYLIGASGRCVYCDHDECCHSAVMEPAPAPDPAAPPPSPYTCEHCHTELLSACVPVDGACMMLRVQCSACGARYDLVDDQGSQMEPAPGGEEG